MQFSELSLAEPLLRAVLEEGYSTPTPVQERSIPHVLSGRDLLAIAQTGTGKTAAFALPVLQRLAARPSPSGRRPVRALVLTPTRELAAQVGEAFETYGRHLPLRATVVFGGVPQRPQEYAISRGVDVLVATPGRLLDLMDQRVVGFDRLEVLVLDEADRMLDMGFLPAVKRILAAVPRRRQTLFFSATMGREPQALANSILVDAARVEVAPQSTTVEKVAQSVYFVEKSEKQALLEHLLGDASIEKALVFTRTKHGADKVVKRLSSAGIDADAIHANKSQRQRERALDGFRSGDHRVLVATDIAARGIDVDGITHVVNFDLPNVPEAYVHRIGRTARAGASGAAIAFCDGSERGYLRDIEREIRMRVPVVEDHPFRRGGSRRGDAVPAVSSGTSASAQPNTPPAAWVEGSPPAPHAPTHRPAPSRPPHRAAGYAPHRGGQQADRGPRRTHGRPAHAGSAQGGSAHGGHAQAGHPHGRPAQGRPSHGGGAHGRNAHASPSQAPHPHASHGAHPHGTHAHRAGDAGSAGPRPAHPSTGSHPHARQGHASHSHSSHPHASPPTRGGGWTHSTARRRGGR